MPRLGGPKEKIDPRYKGKQRPTKKSPRTRTTPTRRTTLGQAERELEGPRLRREEPDVGPEHPEDLLDELNKPDGRQEGQAQGRQGATPRRARRNSLADAARGR